MSTLHIFADQIMQKNNEGEYFSFNSMGLEFWERYLDIFDHLVIVCRVLSAPHPPAGSKPLTHPNIRFVDLPPYQGPLQFASQRHKIHHIVSQQTAICDAALLRMPGAVPGIAARYLARRGKPFSVEVIGDPADAFGRGGVGGAAAWLWRWLFVRSLQSVCASAASVAYVNQTVLPRRYPVADGRFWTHYSNVDLPLSAFAAEPRTGRQIGSRFRLFSAGSMQQPYKGFDTLIEATSRLNAEGHTVEAVFAGDGAYRSQLELIAQACPHPHQVRFLGKIDRDGILAELDRSDLFVLASRTEGLPRVMIEAMARAVPCVGTNVGGIPELLEADDLAPPDDPAALAAAIHRYVDDAELRRCRSTLLLGRARDYANDTLSERRRRFYESIQSAGSVSRTRRAGTPA